MARMEVQYDGTGEQLRTIQAPTVSAVSARLDPRANKAFALAEAFGAAGPAIDKYGEKVIEEQKQKALSWAQSKSIDDLNQAIKDKTLLPSQSPVFVAAVQHTAGQNNRDALERDVISKIERGELTFNNPQELDKYITERRNETLAGKSEYEVTGFDKGWGTFRTKILDANTKLNDKKAVEQAVQIGSDRLYNVISQVTSKDYKIDGKDTVTDQDRVAAVMKEYDLLRTTSVLRDDSAKSAWLGMLQNLARSGQKDLLRTMLDSNLPNNGPKVRFFLGDGSGSLGVQLENVAQSEYDQLQRKVDAEVKTRLSEYQLNEANSAADVLVAGNRGGEIRGVTLANGTTIKPEELADAAITRRIQNDPSMSFADQIALYTRNGVKNAGWERELKTAVNNIGEVNLDASGKPVGTLLPATLDTLDRFAVIRQVSEQYAESLVGESNYKILRRIQALRDLGTGGDASQAAALVNQIEKRQIPKENWGRITDQINTRIDELANPGMFSSWSNFKRNMAEIGRGEWGGSDKNILPVKTHLREIAETYLAAGVAKDGEQAVTMAAEYLGNPAVITQINNTLYLNKDLPRVPKGEEGKTAEWTYAFMDKVIGARLKSAGLPFNMKDLTLLPQAGGQGTFLVALRAQPISNPDGKGFVTVSRKEMENWIASEIDLRQKQQVEKANQNLKSKNEPQPLLGIGEGFYPPFP